MVKCTTVVLTMLEGVALSAILFLEKKKEYDELGDTKCQNTLEQFKCFLTV